MAQLDSKIPEGPLAEKWTNYKAKQKLVNPTTITLSLRLLAGLTSFCEAL